MVPFALQEAQGLLSFQRGWLSFVYQANCVIIRFYVLVCVFLTSCVCVTCET